MPEPNATVDPFDSAGVRLPTEGKGYDGANSATDVKLGPALGGPLPANNVVPGPQTFIQVDIPFAAEGEVIEVEWNCGATPDNTNLNPMTLFGVIPMVVDSSTIPQVFFLQSGVDSSLPGAGVALGDFVSLHGKTAFVVPGGIVYPLTVSLAYTSDGDATYGNNQAVSLSPDPPNLAVQRVKRERVLLVPPNNLI